MGKQYTWKLLKVIETCAEAYDLTLEEIRSPRRCKTACEARIVSTIVGQSLGYGDVEISLALKRHRTTINYFRNEARLRPELVIKASKMIPKLKRIAA